MDIETASLIQNVITGVLFLLWLSTAAFVWATFRLDSSAVDGDPGFNTMSTDLEIGAREALKYAEAQVDGDPAELSARAARLLAEGRMVGPVRVEQGRDLRLMFSSDQSNQFIRRGYIDFQPLGSGRTRISALFVRPRPGKILLWLSLFGCVVGMASLMGTYVLIDRLVVHNANPNVRYQVFQMLQAVHLMWEPFLFAGIYRSQRSAAELALDGATNGLVHNLIFLNDSPAVHENL